MSQDIDSALNGWEFKPGMVQARLVQAHDGRQIIQMRLDLGILQIETTARPDGQRPHGHDTYFDYLRHQARMAEQSGQEFTLSDEQCMEADREFVQFFHRRICWLSLHNYTQAVADADHTLSFMDFVRDHSPSEEFAQVHEQYRGFVLFHRTQALAAQAADQNNAEAAIDHIRDGLAKMKEFFAAHELEEEMDKDAMVQQLRKMEQSLRDKHNIQATLREQFEQAVANEEYEAAARLRDALRERGE